MHYNDKSSVFATLCDMYMYPLTWNSDGGQNKNNVLIENGKYG